MKQVVILILIACCFNSCIISNPRPEDCEIVETKVSKIKEGSSHDIMFFNHQGDFYYINRGLEQGLNLDSLNAKVLNKTVTLYLAKVPIGVTTNHIAQLEVADEIIYTEFD